MQKKQKEQPWERDLGRPGRRAPLDRPVHPPRAYNATVLVGTHTFATSPVELIGFRHKTFLVKGTQESDPSNVARVLLIPPKECATGSHAGWPDWIRSNTRQTTALPVVIGDVSSERLRQVEMTAQTDTFAVLGTLLDDTEHKYSHWYWTSILPKFKWEPKHRNPTGCACTQHQATLRDCVAMRYDPGPVPPVACLLSGCACGASVWCLWCATAYAGEHPSDASRCVYCSKTPNPMGDYLCEGVC